MKCGVEKKEKIKNSVHCSVVTIEKLSSVKFYILMRDTATQIPRKKLQVWEMKSGF